MSLLSWNCQQAKMPYFQVLSETSLLELHIGGLNQSYNNLFQNRINDRNEHKESELLIQAFDKIKIKLWFYSNLWLNDRNLLWYSYLEILTAFFHQNIWHCELQFLSIFRQFLWHFVDHVFFTNNRIYSSRQGVLHLDDK